MTVEFDVLTFIGLVGEELVVLGNELSLELEGLNLDISGLRSQGSVSENIQSVDEWVDGSSDLLEV